MKQPEIIDEPTLTEQSDLKYGVYRSQSTGTDQYHRTSILMKKVLHTDGVQELFEKKQCYWIGDNIVSYIHKLQSMDEPFTVVRIVKSLEDHSCNFQIEDGNYKILIEQHVIYTDLDINVKLFLQYDGEYWVIMMPEEY